MVVSTCVEFLQDLCFGANRYYHKLSSSHIHSLIPWAPLYDPGIRDVSDTRWRVMNKSVPHLSVTAFISVEGIFHFRRLWKLQLARTSMNGEPSCSGTGRTCRVNGRGDIQFGQTPPYIWVYNSLFEHEGSWDVGVVDQCDHSGAYRETFIFFDQYYFFISVKDDTWEERSVKKMSPLLNSGGKGWT